VKNVLAGFRQFKATIPEEARIQMLGDRALGITPWHAEVVMADGTATTIEGRWTVEWAREGSRWLIVHEHVSVPMGGGPMPPGNKPASPKVQ
jgi:ketosteroid isomerase-like protein